MNNHHSITQSMYVVSAVVETTATAPDSGSVLISQCDRFLIELAREIDLCICVN